MIEVGAGPELADGSGDALVVPVFADLTWGPGAEWAAAALGDWVTDYLEAQEFSGKVGQTATLRGGDGLSYGRVVFVGLGAEVDAEGLRRAAGSAAISTRRFETVVTTLHAVDVDGAEELVTFGFLLGQYRFDKYMSDPKPSKTDRLVLAGGADVDAGVRRGGVIAEAVSLARDLVNEPAVAKPPAELASVAQRIADEQGLEIRVYDEAEIEAEGFGGLHGVSLGATNPPRMVVLRYSPEGATRTVAFVGKGIVFDSGGLSLKTAKGMETMKTDMSGAAAVFGAVQAVASLGLSVNVIGITPITENLTGGSAQRPGDVLRARNGKTIEVLNTDAEGRLVLADGLALAAEDEPDLIVDIATLTGACAVALGPKIGGVFAGDDEVAATLIAAAKRAGEQMWQLPLEAEYRPYIDSDVADMQNTSSQRYGGAISAALLLAEFVGEVPWAHLDIAGPARASSAEHYVTKGGTGFGVRTLVEIAAAYAE
jgi:leucyl aminopeptidase